jgi:hypothetical protein
MLYLPIPSRTPNKTIMLPNGGISVALPRTAVDKDSTIIKP